MRPTLIISTVCFVLSTAFSFFWGAGDGAKYSRCMQDLREITPKVMKARQIIDPWGNPYLEATVTYGESTSSYVFSIGPDGFSETGGNDPDDISIWTGEYEWMDSQIPNRWISFVAVAFSLLVSSCSCVALITRRRYRAAV